MDERKEDHDQLADHLEQEADELEQESEELGQDIDQTRKDWESKRRREVTGALPLEDADETGEDPAPGDGAA